MNKYFYAIDAGWRGDDSSPSLIAERLAATLDQFERIDPAMTHWAMLDLAEANPVPFATVRADLAGWVERGVYKDDDGSADPRRGYTVLMWGGETHGRRGTRNTLHLSVDVGSQWSNRIDFKIGDLQEEPDQDLITYDRFRRILDVIAETWPCPWASANLYVAPEQSPVLTSWPNPEIPPPRSPETYSFPWIIYLSAPLIAGLAPASDLVCDNTPGGGMVLSTARDRLDGRDPDQLRRSRQLQKIISDAGCNGASIYDGASGLPARVGPY